MTALYQIHLLDGWLPTSLFGLIAVGLIVILAMGPAWARGSHTEIRHMKADNRGTLISRLMELGIAAVGGIVGWILVWLVSDVFVLFGVGVGWAVMLAVAVTFGLLSLQITVVIDSHSIRRIIAAVMIPLTLLGCATEINIIYGEYATFGNLFGKSQYQQLKSGSISHHRTTVQTWLRLAAARKLASIPSKGQVSTVEIPGSVSHFKARTAALYLPPAALSNTPPTLPVMIMLSGQPGGPSQFFDSSKIASFLDAYASQHHGLAPIVVSPDQNGASSHNSLCANTSVYGNAETYLSVDVTNWVKRNLPVAPSPQSWLIGGFSQGGTCSTQLGPAYPNTYGHIFAVDGELEPTDRNESYTIAHYFNSDAKLYRAHVPTEVIKNNAPSTQTLFTAAGSWDRKSQNNQAAIGKAAIHAGMNVTTVITGSSGHDWHAVQTALEPLIDSFSAQTGLGKPSRPLSSYPKIQVITLH